MADITLKTDYKDDVLDTSVNTQRKYQMIQNEDGTVSFVDVTEYSQVGDSFGSADVNAIAEAYNELNSKFEWKLHDTKVGIEAITLPSNYSEILVMIQIPYTSYNIVTTTSLLKEFVDLFVTQMHFVDLGNYNTNVRVGVNKNTLVLNTCSFSGTSYLDTTTIKVFYR